MMEFEKKKLEDMSADEVLGPFFRIAKLSMMMMKRLLPDGVKFTLVARWPGETHPVLFGDDDLREVEKVLHAINGDFRGEIFNAECLGDFAMPKGKPN